MYATTEDLASLSQLNTNAVQEIYILTGAILEDLVAVLRTYIGVLLKMADAVALLDMLRSFAHLVSISDTFCRPEFADGPLAIRAGRHPMAESFANKEFVPNNTMISPTTCSLSVITGPNMAGKSSYIKQVALITILSHIGIRLKRPPGWLCTSKSTHNFLLTRPSCVVRILRAGRVCAHATD